MWLVQNTLKATLSLRGLDVSIPAGEQFDLDVIGRAKAETSNQVLVALEEGYLANVYKGASAGGSGRIAAPDAASLAGLSAEQFEARMHEFKSAFIDELKSQLSTLPVEGPPPDAALSADVRALVDEVKLMRQRFESERAHIQTDSTLSDGEVRARLAFLEEKERELLKNFETVGKQVEQDDGDVMDKADLLAGL